MREALKNNLFCWQTKTWQVVLGSGVACTNYFSEKRDTARHRKGNSTLYLSCVCPHPVRWYAAVLPINGALLWCNASTVHTSASLNHKRDAGQILNQFFDLSSLRAPTCLFHEGNVYCRWSSSTIPTVLSYLLQPDSSPSVRPARLFAPTPPPS